MAVFAEERRAPTLIEAVPAADPAPLGLAAFALTTFVLSGHNATFIPDVVWVGLALFYGGLVQLLAGMWEFRNRNVCRYFEEHGYATNLSKPPGEILDHGFTHSLGHGVGLEVHEQPALGRAGHELVAGDVITLEPGLYRRGFGGCRLEDLVLVTEDGAENLTQYPYDLEP